MLTARKRPTPWTGHGDVVVRIAPDVRALERGRPADGPPADVDPVALVLIHPDTETALTSTIHCATPGAASTAPGPRRSGSSPTPSPGVTSRPTST
ncbi:hypothetical protein ACFSUJ_34315 [Streptomyces lusitanus]|uniref:Uncharacterized protein n=1 Tax=Streptomyces lusitanus TaxID=68232 RepID=A0ABU3K1Z9_9ACTN|nr:hypothetical protein [Streptomyces lusitanus]